MLTHLVLTVLTAVGAAMLLVCPNVGPSVAAREVMIRLAERIGGIAAASLIETVLRCSACTAVWCGIIAAAVGVWPACEIYRWPGLWWFAAPPLAYMAAKLVGAVCGREQTAADEEADV